MPIGSGLSAQVGFGVESPAGTRAVPTRFFELRSENVKFKRNRIESMGLRAGGRRVGPTRYAEGTRDGAGPLVIECAPQGFGILLRHMFGSLVTTGAGPTYTHTATAGDLDDDTLTTQFGRMMHSGTVQPFDYLGCSITDWALDLDVNQYLLLTPSLYVLDEDTSQTLATASYPAAITPFVFTGGSVTLAGSAQDVKKISLAGKNNLATGRHQISATNPGRPKQAKEEKRREYTGNLTADFTDMTIYNRFKNLTEAALVLAFAAAGGYSLTITGNIRSDGDTPNIPGDQLLEQGLPFKFLSGTSDAAAFTAVLVNGDATP